jgi:hypothetical protein
VLCIGRVWGCLVLCRGVCMCGVWCGVCACGVGSVNYPHVFCPYVAWVSDCDRPVISHLDLFSLGPQFKIATAQISRHNQKPAYIFISWLWDWFNRSTYLKCLFLCRGIVTR